MRDCLAAFQLRLAVQPLPTEVYDVRQWEASRMPIRHKPQEQPLGMHGPAVVLREQLEWGSHTSPMLLLRPSLPGDKLCGPADPLLASGSLPPDAKGAAWSASLTLLCSFHA